MPTKKTRKDCKKEKKIFYVDKERCRSPRLDKHPWGEETIKKEVKKEGHRYAFDEAEKVVGSVGKVRKVVQPKKAVGRPKKAVGRPKKVKEDDDEDEESDEDEVVFFDAKQPSDIGVEDLSETAVIHDTDFGEDFEDLNDTAVIHETGFGENPEDLSDTVVIHETGFGEDPEDLKDTLEISPEDLTETTEIHEVSWTPKQKGRPAKLRNTRKTLKISKDLNDTLEVPEGLLETTEIDEFPQFEPQKKRGRPRKQPANIMDILVSDSEENGIPKKKKGRKAKNGRRRKPVNIMDIPAQKGRRSQIQFLSIMDDGKVASTSTMLPLPEWAFTKNDLIGPKDVDKLWQTIKPFESSLPPPLKPTTNVLHFPEGDTQIIEFEDEEFVPTPPTPETQKQVENAEELLVSSLSMDALPTLENLPYFFGSKNLGNIATSLQDRNSVSHDLVASETENMLSDVFTAVALNTSDGSVGELSQQFSQLALDTSEDAELIAKFKIPTPKLKDGVHFKVISAIQKHCTSRSDVVNATVRVNQDHQASKRYMNVDGALLAISNVCDALIRLDEITHVVGWHIFSNSTMNVVDLDESSINVDSIIRSIVSKNASNPFYVQFLTEITVRSEVAKFDSSMDSYIKRIGDISNVRSAFIACIKYLAASQNNIPVDFYALETKKDGMSKEVVFGNIYEALDAYHSYRGVLDKVSFDDVSKDILLSDYIVNFIRTMIADPNGMRENIGFCIKEMSLVSTDLTNVVNWCTSAEFKTQKGLYLIRTRDYDDARFFIHGNTCDILKKLEETKRYISNFIQNSGSKYLDTMGRYDKGKLGTAMKEALFDKNSRIHVTPLELQGQIRMIRLPYAVDPSTVIDQDFGIDKIQSLVVNYILTTMIDTVRTRYDGRAWLVVGGKRDKEVILPALPGSLLALNEGGNLISDYISSLINKSSFKTQNITVGKLVEGMVFAAPQLFKNRIDGARIENVSQLK